MFCLSELLSLINPEVEFEMEKRNEIFEGEDPFVIAQRWLNEAEQVELNDPNAMALSTVDESGMPNARMVLLKSVDKDSFVFYTNYGSIKAKESFSAGKVAFVIHWKSLRRQIRCRGTIEREEGAIADEYFLSRSPLSRAGAVASKQSKELESRQILMDRVSKIQQEQGNAVVRPAFWGGIRIRPVELEFWADGDARLHDRFRWEFLEKNASWSIKRLYP
jgi:pyridoxamine 5'-phosphate oxidase